MALRSVRVCRHAREELCRPASNLAGRQKNSRRALIESVLLAGASLIAIAASNGARAQETQLPELTVEASKPKGKKKPAAAKSPAPQAAPVSAPQPPPASGSMTVQASDVPYTVPAGVSVVTSEDLSTFGGGNIDSALRSQPGTFTRMSPQNPGLAVNIRGFEGSGRVNTMIDGVRQNFRFTGHEAQGFTYVDPSLVAGIDIARGAVSTAGGAGALAGAANFRTLDVEDILKPGQTVGGLTSLTWGSNGVGFSEMGAAAATSGGVSIAGAISRREPDDYENGDGETIPFTFQDLNSGLFKVNFQLNDEQSLRFGGVFYDNDFFANSYFQNVNSETFTAKYAYKPIDNDLIDFRLNGYRNHVVMKYDADSATTPGQGSSWGRVIDDEGWGFDVSNVSRFNLGSVRVRSEYGYEYFRDDVDAYNRFQTQLDGGVNPSGVSDVSGVFSQTTFSQSIFDFIVGLRYDMYALDGHGVVPTGTPLPPGVSPGPYTVDRSEGRFDPKLTLAAQVLDWLQPYVTYSESFRAPTISETLTGGIHPGGTSIAFQPNPFLDPEIQKGWEFGANVMQNDVLTRGDSFRLKADYYFMDIENYITGCLIPVPRAQPVSYFCNAPGTSLVQGVEIQGMYDAGYAFSGFSYTYTNTDLPSQIDGFGAHSYLPDHTAVLSGGVRLLDRKLTLGGRVSYFSESYIGAINAGTPAQRAPYGSPYMPGYTLVDFFSSYKFDQGVELGFNVNNVFDEVYTPALSTTFSEGTKCYGSNQVGCIDSGIGRTFFLTAKAQF
jgi:hemoglobin/transferrin/lactoferrin receptor protein